MGKGELWDDSALMKAFDRAISTYKVTHGDAEEKDVDGEVARAKGELDCGSRELCSQTQPETGSKLEEAASNSQAVENSPLGPNSDEKSPEGYRLLLSKYYELEDQSQKVLQQIYQYQGWNSDYQASVPQAYDNVTCYCPYGCQNWVVPCNSSQVPSPECACSGKAKELTNGTDQSIESAPAATDLTVVLNAWYSAGFYTAKYLSEQSAANKK